MFITVKPKFLIKHGDIYNARFVGWASPTTRGRSRRTLVGDAHPTTTTATAKRGIMFKYSSYGRSET